MPRVAAACVVALVFSVVCHSSAGQTRISSARGARRENADPDEILLRQHWFRQGREGVRGKSAAALRLEAYRQMVAKRRALNEVKSQALRIAGTSSALSQVWTQLGPSPIVSNPTGNPAADYDYGSVIGRVTSLAVDPSDVTGNTVYVGGATGGLWKSSNAANATTSSITWTPLLDAEPTLSVGGIGIQPGNSNVLVLGTGEPNFSIDSYYALGFLRSTDAGATWTLITSANSGAGGFTMDLRGIALGSVVFSTDNPSLVVAGAGASGVGFENGIETITDERFGVFYSADAGQTWTRATFFDGTTLVKPWSVDSIVYNAARHLFYAAVGFQGMYSSSDGANWTRLAAQPGAGLSLSNCPAYFSTTCPMLRGALTIKPGADEMYVWYVDINSDDQGIYKTTDGGQSWTALDESGVTNCGDAAGCGTEQGFFNLVLNAVPQPNGGTDLYAGAVNVFKCSITSANPTCAVSPFVNLTHVYGCSPIGSLAHVHPDQHAIAFAPGNSQLIYFGNDGGIYRSLNATGLSSGSCGQSPNSFDNLNGTMGSMAQFVWLSGAADNQDVLLGGTQDNGSPARTAAIAAWPAANIGDGGFNAINPTSSNEWFTAHTDVSIERCTLGVNCTTADFSPVVTNAVLAGDAGPFYTPYILDPQAPSEMLVGTCRLWRGPSSGGLGWTALSNNFDTADGTACSANAQQQIRAIAAGGPVTTNGSQVIWIGTTVGDIWMTLSADGGPAMWSNIPGSPFRTPISSIVMDPRDPTGKTVYFTTLDFSGYQVQLISPTAHTGQPTGDLPNVPADSLAFDPEFPDIMYVGTDIGVFQSVNGGTNWTEVGAGSLPSAPVSHLEIFRAPGVKKLRASTYGRGVWETDLATGSIPLVSFSNYKMSFPAQAIGSTSPPTVVTLKNIGSSTLSLTGFLLSGTEFAQTNDCPTTLAAAASCSISVTFSPSSSGNHSGSLSLSDDANDSPQVVQLVGNIPTPAARLVQSALTFGNIAVGGVDGPQPAIVASSGTGPLTVTSVSVTGDFSQSNNCIGLLSVNQQCTVKVSFRPTASGLRQGTLLIADDASDSPQSISLAGTGVNELVISTNFLQFPHVLVGQSVGPNPITLSNFTSTAIGISQIVLQGPNASDFSESNDCGTSVPSQASCVVNISFAPTAGNVRSTNFFVTDTNGNKVGAGLLGTGDDFVLNSSTFPSTLTIGAGQTANFTVWLGPQGSFQGTVSVSCDGGPPGSACTVSPTSVAFSSGSGGAPITVSVKTAVVSGAPLIAYRVVRYRGHRFETVELCFIALFLMLLFALVKRRERRVAISSLGLLLLALGVVGLVGSCGGGGSSSPPPPPAPTSSTIVVTGTSGSLKNTTALTLIVNH